MNETTGTHSRTILVPAQLAPDRMPGAATTVDRSLLALPGLREFLATTFFLLGRAWGALLPGRTAVIPRRPSG